MGYHSLLPHLESLPGPEINTDVSMGSNAAGLHGIGLVGISAGIILCDRICKKDQKLVST